LKTALDAEGIEFSVWCIHRKIGMSGGLFTNPLLREIEVEIDPERIELLRRGHAEAYQRHASEIRPLPGARKPLVGLIQAAIPWAIACRPGASQIDDRQGNRSIRLVESKTSSGLDKLSREVNLSLLRFAFRGWHR
jgi:hypothetical protein